MGFFSGSADASTGASTSIAEDSVGFSENSSVTGTEDVGSSVLSSVTCSGCDGASGASGISVSKEAGSAGAGGSAAGSAGGSAESMGSAAGSSGSAVRSTEDSAGAGVPMGSGVGSAGGCDGDAEERAAEGASGAGVSTDGVCSEVSVFGGSASPTSGCCESGSIAERGEERDGKRQKINKYQQYSRVTRGFSRRLRCAAA